MFVSFYLLAHRGGKKEYFSPVLVTRKLRGSCYILVISIPLTLLECPFLRLSSGRWYFTRKREKIILLRRFANTRDDIYIYIYISTKDRKNADEIGILPYNRPKRTIREKKLGEKISMKQRSNNSLYRSKIHRERRLRGRKMQRRKFSPGACIPFVNCVVRTLAV